MTKLINKKDNEDTPTRMSCLLEFFFNGTANTSADDELALFNVVTMTVPMAVGLKTFVSSH